MKEHAKKHDTPGTLFVIAAPSGGGKTSIVKQLLTQDAQLKLSISHTTRAMRPQEVHGQHYFFVTQPEFEHMVDEQQFLEHATVFGHSYGTSIAQVLAPLNAGLDVILEIDWQGAQQVRTLFANIVTVFILPPSYEILAARLIARGQDNTETIQYRMQKAHDEMIHCAEFDYVVFNDEFDRCVDEIQAIIDVQRLRYNQQKWRNTARLQNLLKLI